MLKSYKPKLQKVQRVYKLMFNLAFAASLMPWQERRKAFVIAGFTLLTVFAVLFIGTGINNALAPEGSHDLQWTPAKDLLDGVDPYRQFMNWSELDKAPVPPHFLNQSPSYPASVYVLLAPLGHLDWSSAKLVWLVANLVFIGLLLYGLQSVFPVKSPALLALVVLTFLIASPLRTSLGAGQHNLISLAAFIWAYYFAFKGNRTRLSGFLLAIAWIKYSITFPLTLIFLQRGGYKPIVIAAAIHAALTAIAAWRLGQWPHEFFFNSVKVVFMGDGTGFLNLVALSMNLDLPLTPTLAAIALTTAIATIGLIRYKNPNELLVMAFLGLLSCAVFYHHGYDFIVLIFCAWALARRELHGTGTVMTTFCLLLLAWVGQWLATELSLYSGNGLVVFTDYLLISVFYYTLFLIGKSIYQRRVAFKTVNVPF